MTERDWFREYCEKSTGHGVKYFVMKRRSLIEKTFWILTFVFLTSLTCFSLMIVICIWINSFTVIFIENKESSIREIPFPSVTVCPTNQLRKSIWETHKNFNTAYWKNINHYHLLTCTSMLYLPKWPQGVYEQYFEYDMLKRVVNDCTMSCSELFQSDIKWQNVTLRNFCQYMQPKLTVFGICFSFNLLPVHQMLNDEYHKRYMDFFAKNNSYVDDKISIWNLDNRYSLYSNSDNMLVDVYPLRTGGISYYHRLRLMMHNMDNAFLGCPNHGLESSFFVAINNPTEFYTFDTRTFIQLETFNKIQITPFVRNINKDLLWRPLEIRKCYLHNERKLSIFKQYSQSNCNYECAINVTMSMCDCVYFDAAYLVSAGVKICSPSKESCVYRSLKQADLPTVQAFCNCLPTCSVIEYNIANTFYYDNWTYMRTTNLVTNDSIGATLEIVFKKPYFAAYTTSSIFNFSSLISTIGGISSFLLGINTISFYEIVYVIIQMVYNYIKNMFDRQ